MDERSVIDSVLGPELDLTRDTDQRAVECATRLFPERGIAQVRMTDIADASGIGVATLYRHFSTKGRIAACAGTLLWRHFNERILAFVESDEFLTLDGYERLGALFSTYCHAYVDMPDFVGFVDEFDHLVCMGQIDRADLGDYGAAIDSFYIVFDDCYLLGRQDGSIARELDFSVFYHSCAHALMGLAAKLARGEIIASDDFSDGEAELRCLAESLLLSLKVATNTVSSTLQERTSTTKGEEHGAA